MPPPIKPGRPWENVALGVIAGGARTTQGLAGNVADAMGVIERNAATAAPIVEPAPMSWSEIPGKVWGMMTMPPKKMEVQALANSKQHALQLLPLATPVKQAAEKLFLESKTVADNITGALPKSYQPVRFAAEGLPSFLMAGPSKARVIANPIIDIFNKRGQDRELQTSTLATLAVPGNSMVSNVVQQALQEGIDGARADGGPVKKGGVYLTGEEGPEILTDGQRLQVVGAGGPELIKASKDAFVIPSGAEFGGFRARGGPVRPGRAYMVGERGPEMIVPQTPGMVIPNGAVPSPMNRGYAPGSLAGRGPTPVGRGIDDPARQSERLNRIARQQFGQTGDPSLMLSMNWRTRQGGGGPLPPASVNGQPAEVLPPAGRMVPGRSTGSMVWQPDNPAYTPPALPGEAPPTFGPVPTVQPAQSPMEFGPPGGGFIPPALPAARMPDGSLDTSQPLPPSTLGGGTGVPPPPALDFRPLPGNPGYGVPFVNGEPQKQFLPLPAPPPQMQLLPLPGSDLRIPTLGDKRVPGLPMFQEQMVPGSLVRRETQGRDAPRQMTPVEDAKAPRIQSINEGDVKTNVQWNAQKNRWERVKIYDPGDPDDNGIPGDQRSGGTVAPAAANGKPVSKFLSAFGA